MKCSRCSQVATTKYRGKWLCSFCMKDVRDRQAQRHNQQKCVVCGQTASQGGLLCSRCREAKQEEIRTEIDNLLCLIGEADTLEELKNATLDMFEYMHENN